VVGDRQPVVHNDAENGQTRHALDVHSPGEAVAATAALAARHAEKTISFVLSRLSRRLFAVAHVGYVL